MRVCLISSLPLPPEEGIGHHVWNLAQQLKKRGHQVGIITRGRAGSTTEERSAGITIWRAPFVPIYPFHVHLHGVFVNRLMRQIEEQFDVINAHTPLPPAVDTKLPLITTVHSPMKADTAATNGFDLRVLALRLQTPVSQWIEKALFRRSRKITAVARWIADALRSYGVEPTGVMVTGNGVEACFLNLSPLARKEPCVLYVGRLEMGKGLSELVEAARIVVNRYPESKLRFVLVGKGPLLPKLLDQVNQAGVQNHFVFRGHIGSDQRNELVELYQKASLFVLPSHHEGMPTVLLEAMASGLPVVSTAVGGAREVVVDGENGLLVPPRAPEELAEALLALLENVTLRQRLGQNARATIEQHYTWGAISERYLTCFEQVLNDHV